jgi:tRNA 2-thiouridine synthesizing protein C
VERLVLLTRRSPYGGAGAREAIDTALAAAAFDLPVTVVFDGDGVWQLVRGQAPGAIEEKSVGANLEALPMFEVEDVRVTRRALAARGIDASELVLPVEVIDDAAMAALLASADQVLAF